MFESAEIPDAAFLWTHTREGLAVLEEGGTILLANPALCEFLGYAPGELAGKNFRDITASVDIAADAAAFDRLRRGEIDSYTMNKLYRPKMDKLKPGRLRVQRISGGRLLVLGQVLPLDAFEAADVPPEERAKIVSLAVADLAALAFKNWKTVLAILAIIAGLKADDILKVLSALGGK